MKRFGALRAGVGVGTRGRVDYGVTVRVEVSVAPPLEAVIFTVVLAETAAVVTLNPACDSPA